MQRRNPLLTMEEFSFCKSHVTLTRELGIAANRTVTINKGKERSEDVELDGGTPNMAVIGSYEVDEGRYFSETENTRHMNVAFVGHDVEAKFFRQGDPIGQTINLEGIPFEVVGVAKAKGSRLRHVAG